MRTQCRTFVRSPLLRPLPAANIANATILLCLLAKILQQQTAATTIGKKIDDEVAVYYAYGEINDAPATGFNQEHTITTQQTITDLQELREDEDVKAVVIRVNSPGGSAYASEQIWHEVQLLRAEKPVVISMGGMAASGGYYISHEDYSIKEIIFGVFSPFDKCLTELENEAIDTDFSEYVEDYREQHMDE